MIEGEIYVNYTIKIMTYNIYAQFELQKKIDLSVSMLIPIFILTIYNILNVYIHI